MRKNLSSIFVSVCTPAKKLWPSFCTILDRFLEAVKWFDSTGLSLGINASKVAVNVLARHQSPEYRPCEIFSPLVCKVATWHPHSCTAVLKYNLPCLVLYQPIEKSMWECEGKFTSFFSHEHSVSPGNPVALALTEVCVLLTSLHVAETETWPNLNTLLLYMTRLSLWVSVWFQIRCCFCARHCVCCAF